MMLTERIDGVENFVRVQAMELDEGWNIVRRFRGIVLNPLLDRKRFEESSR
jgi:hypothetical protein